MRDQESSRIRSSFLKKHQRGDLTPLRRLGYNRRHQPMPTSPLASQTDRYVYEFDGFRVAPVRRRLFRGDEAVSVTPKALAILLVLLEKRGQVVEKEELIQR